MRGYSYFELLISIIIVATLSTLAVQHYSVERERALDSQAQTNLVTIIASERDSRRQAGSFFISNDEATLNANLAGVLLSTADMKWNYAITQDGAGVVCCAEATRNDPGARSWRLCTNGNTPVSGGCGAAAANCP